LQLTTIFIPTETLLYTLAPALAESVEEILLYRMEGQNSSWPHNVECPFTMKSVGNCASFQWEVTHVTMCLHLTHRAGNKLWASSICSTKWVFY